jgi:alpha-N-acetylglucosamine transferase
MTYLNARFHILISNGSLVIAVKQEAKEQFCTAAMLLLYSLQEENLTKVAYVSVIYYFT